MLVRTFDSVDPGTYAFPKFMVHPHEKLAPTLYGPVTVRNHNQECLYAERGYVPRLYAPWYEESKIAEYPKWVGDTLCDNKADEMLILSAMAADARKKRKKRGRR